MGLSLKPWSNRSCSSYGHWKWGGIGSKSFCTSLQVIGNGEKPTPMGWVLKLLSLDPKLILVHPATNSSPIGPQIKPTFCQNKYKLYQFHLQHLPPNPSNLLQTNYQTFQQYSNQEFEDLHAKALCFHYKQAYSPLYQWT